MQVMLCTYYLVARLCEPLQEEIKTLTESAFGKTLLKCRMDLLCTRVKL